LRSTLLDRLTGKAFARASDAERGWGATGAYGQRYAPESRKEFVEAFRDRVWANRCVRLIASSSTQVNMRVRRGKVWTDEHPLLDLLRRPSRRDPALMFFEWAIQWGEITGDWFWEIVPGIDGKQIAELYPLRSHLVEVKPGEGGPKGYVYDPNMNAVNVIQYDAADPDEPRVTGEGGNSVVLAGRWPNPFDDLYGLAPMRAAKDAIVSSYYMVRYDHKFFRNSARPDLIVGFKGKVDEDQRKMNREAWDDFKGVDNAFRAAIFGGDPSVNLVTQTQRDIEYAEGRRVAREEECAAFGVPPVLVGDMTRATYSNFENAEPIFWKITMVPKLAYFAAWTNAALLPFFPDIEEFGFDVSQVPALARAEGWRAERAGQEVNDGLATPNEGREQVGKEPHEEEGADVLWRPTKSRPMHDLYQAEPEPQLHEQPPAAEGKARPFALERKEVVADWLRQALEAKLRFALRARTEITSHFAAQERDILEIVEGEEDKASEVEKALLEYGWSENDEKFHEVVEAMQVALTEASFEITAQALGEHTPSEGLIEATVKQIANRADGIGSVTGRVKDEVIDQVREGLQHGLTYRQIAEGGTFTSGVAGEGDVTIKGIKGVYEEYKTWQGERIARTEAAYTFNVSSAKLMRDAAITHVDIADGDEDEDCALANGSRWSLAEYEANPLGHPNCTRIGLPVLEAS
jgi:HK97 family phage portal protein